MIQNFKNFKNNQMGSKLNEGANAASIISAYYDNQIKQLQALKKDSLKDFTYLMNELSTLFGMDIVVDGSNNFRLVGNLRGMPIVTATEIYKLFSKTDFGFVGVGGNRVKEQIYSANDLVNSSFEYILITDVIKSAE